jgi:hypothetical protein
LWLFQTKTAKEQRGCRLFYRSPNRRQPRISAVDEISMADSLLDEQQKTARGAMRYDIIRR